MLCELVCLDRLPRTKCTTVINEGDYEGYSSALHYAAMFNRFKIMQLLVTRGASERAACVVACWIVKYQAKDNYTPQITSFEQCCTTDSSELTLMMPLQ